MGKVSRLVVGALSAIAGGVAAGVVFSVSPALSLVMLVPMTGLALFGKARKAVSLAEYRWDVVIMFTVAFVCLTIAYLFSTMTPSELKDLLIVTFAFLAGLIGSRVAGL